uniref:SRR1 domain-containing protein n=1 Tax=Steinernema glaseri TaxID=37863 RepID=A0A1I7Y5L7_9BILA
MEEGGFQMYCSRKKKKLPMMAPSKAHCRTVLRGDLVSVELIDENLKKADEAIVRSGLSAKTQYFLEKLLDGRRIRTMRGVGIGNFGQRPSSSGSLQMALFLAIRSHFQPDLSTCQDPVMNSAEVEYLQRIGVETPAADDLLKPEEDLLGDDVVLFFMPHCGHALYNNLLWSNWDVDALRNLVIIGNDFSKLVVLEKHEEEIEALLKYRNLADVVAFPPSVDDAFSDTALMTFSTEELPTIGRAKPKYNHFACELLPNKK